MRYKNVMLFAVALVLLPVVAFGQLKEQQKPQPFSQLLTSPLSAPQGLIGLIGLDPNRFSMQQSYSLSYTSWGGHGYSQGVYLNTMSYRFSDPLQVSLQWGILNQPLGSFGVSSLYQSGFFFSGASVEYKPSRNLSIGLQVNRTPGGWLGYPYRDYYYDARLRPHPASDSEENR
jgi:hypothetical protein